MAVGVSRAQSFSQLNDTFSCVHCPPPSLSRKTLPPPPLLQLENESDGTVGVSTTPPLRDLLAGAASAGAPLSSFESLPLAEPQRHLDALHTSCHRISVFVCGPCAASQRVLPSGTAASVARAVHGALTAIAAVDAAAAANELCLSPAMDTAFQRVRDAVVAAWVHEWAAVMTRDMYSVHGVVLTALVSGVTEELTALVDVRRDDTGAGGTGAVVDGREEPWRRVVQRLARPLVPDFVPFGFQALQSDVMAYLYPA